MRRIAVALVAFVLLAMLACVATEVARAGDAPADRVVVMYFHRTNPCPTCRTMSAYTEEAVKNAFAAQMKQGKVEYHYIDFEDEKNEALVKGYDVSRPTLIVVKVVANKAKDQKNLAEMWTKVRDKDAFVEYVQTNVKEYLK
jgi:thiol-disulfide isomerase/thioredoxin